MQTSTGFRNRSVSTDSPIRAPFGSSENNRNIYNTLEHSLEQQTVLSHRVNDSRHREHGAEHADQQSGHSARGHDHLTSGSAHLHEHIQQRGVLVDLRVRYCGKKVPSVRSSDHNIVIVGTSCENTFEYNDSKPLLFLCRSPRSKSRIR